jgi:3-oxoacid CoA-transferase
MTHTSRDGAPKIVPQCTLPLTARAEVDVIITELAVFVFIDDQLTLTELMPGVELEEVRAKTSAAFKIALVGGATQ